MTYICAVNTTTKKMKIQVKEWVRIFSNHISDKRLLFRIQTKGLQLSNINMYSLILKRANDLIGTCPKKWYKLLIQHEKILNIIRYYRYANQNHNEVPINVHYDGYNKIDTNRCWLGCGEIGIFINCWGDCEVMQPQPGSPSEC